MALPLNPNDKNFPKILAIKQAVSSSILTATARVRAGDLRPTNDDGLSALLDQVKGQGQTTPDDDWPNAEDMLA